MSSLSLTLIVMWIFDNQKETDPLPGRFSCLLGGHIFTVYRSSPPGTLPRISQTSYRTPGRGQLPPTCLIRCHLARPRFQAPLRGMQDPPAESSNFDPAYRVFFPLRDPAQW